MKNLLILILTLAVTNVRAQFKNNNFNNGSTGSVPHVIDNWTNGNTQWVPQDFVTYEDPFIDLTGTGFGNGNYIEQSIYTAKGKKYKITFDLGTFFGWDLYDAGVTISLDGVNLGSRIYHNEFTNSRDTFMRWKRLSTITFNGSDNWVKVRFTGNSQLVTSYGFNSGPGVIGLDNVTLEDVTSSALETNSEDQFQIFPNPANVIINISGSDHFSNLTYVISDLSGKEIVHGIVINNQVDVNAIPAGLFLLHLNHQESRNSVHRISVQH